MNKTIEDWRKEIDLLDEELLKILSKRVLAVKEVGKLKKKLGLEILDEKRWQEIIATRLKKAQELGLAETTIKEIFDKIHEYMLQLEKDIE